MKGGGVARYASVVAFFIAGTAWGSDGLITRPSAHSVATTLERLETALKAKGYVIFARLDHAAAAAAVGIQMPASTVLVFGNPRAGSPAMKRKPTLAVDLPLKALVWEDASGKVSLTYNSGDYVLGTLFPRHGLPANPERKAELEKFLSSVVDAAVK